MRFSGEEHKLEIGDSNEVPDISRSNVSRWLDALNKIKETIQVNLQRRRVKFNII